MLQQFLGSEERDIQKSRTVKICDPSGKVDIPSKVVRDRKVVTEFTPGPSVLS